MGGGQIVGRDWSNGRDHDNRRLILEEDVGMLFTLTVSKEQVQLERVLWC